MKALRIFIFFFCIGLIGNCQEIVFSEKVDKKAEYPGGQAAIGRFFQKNVAYNSKNFLPCGKVKLKILVQIDGKAELNKCENYCDSLCLAFKIAIDKMEKWNPAEIKKQKVISIYSIPVQIDFFE